MRFKLTSIFCLTASLAFSQMNGNYTIDPKGSGSRNFTSIQSAADSLMKSGISGSTVFKIANGTYYEQVRIGKVNGVSAKKSVTFRSDANDSTKVTLSWPANKGGDYIWLLDSSDYISVEKMTMIRTGPSNSSEGRMVILQGGSSYNKIKSCRLFGIKRFSLNTNTNYIIYSPSAKKADNYNSIINNLIRFGSSGICMFGSTSESGNLIEGNSIDSFTKFGIFINNQNGLTITGNRVSATLRSNASIMLYGGTGGSVTRNIIMTNSIGISASSFDTTLIANNQIIVNAYYGYAKAIEVENHPYLILHNTILLLGTPLDARAISIDFSLAWSGVKDSVLIENNSICDMTTNGTGSCLFFYHSWIGTTYKVPLNSNFNNYYSRSGIILNYYGKSYTTLSSLQSLNGSDSNSYNLNPYYSALKINTRCGFLDGTANPNANVLTDCTGKKRDNTHPDIGAFEFQIDSTDAALISIDSPSFPFCSGKRIIYLRILNSGLNTLNSATINWKINGTTQSKITWTGNLKKDSCELIPLGAYVFSASETYTIECLLGDPNGKKDNDSSNNSLEVDLLTSMMGSYTLGGSNPDFNSFNEAVNSLIFRGICGPVEINIRDGIYTENILIPEISGASYANTITFQGTTNDSTIVVIKDLWNVITLEGADFIRIKKISVLGDSSYEPIVLKNGACNNIIEGCYVKAGKNGCAVYLGYSKNDRNVLTGNLIRSGGTGITSTLASQLSLLHSFNLKVIGNTIDSFYQDAIEVFCTDSVFIYGNKVVNKNPFMLDAAGIEVWRSNGPLYIYKNTVDMETGGFGIEVQYCSFNNSVNTGIVANNFVTVSDSDARAFYIQDVDSLNIIYNNSRNTSTRGPSCTMMGVSDTGIFMCNNNLINDSYGIAIIYNYSTFLKCDYNNLTSYGLLGQYKNKKYANLNDWQNYTKLDKNSLSTNPQYFSNTDLHIKNRLLIHKGIPLAAITTDFDGQQRSKNQPGIGADELYPYSNDIRVANITSPITLSCGNSNTDIKATFVNNGDSDQKNVKVYAEISGFINKTFQDTISFLAAGTSYNKTFDSSINTAFLGSLQIKIYHALVNDSDKTNDTISNVYYFFKPTVTDTPSNIRICGPGYTMLSGTCLQNETLYWYDSLTGKTPFAIGNNVSSPNLKRTDTFWVQAVPLSGPCAKGMRVPFVVFVDSVSTASFTSKNVCYGKVSNFFNISKGSIKSSLWNFGDGDSSSQLNPVHLYTFPGKYNVLLTVTNQNGCKDTISNWVEVYDLPHPSFSCMATCEGDSAVFTNSSTGTIKNQNWNFGDGNSDTSMNPKHVYVNDGTYTVWLKTTNAEGCSDSISNTIKILARPKAGFISSRYCNADSVRFTNKTTGQIYSYYWKFGDGATSPLTNPSHHYIKPGNYVVSLRAISMTSCEDTYLETITVIQSIGSTIKAVACYSYVFAGKVLTTTGVYFDTLTNIYGCDSIITLYLTINKATSSTLNISSCDYYVFGGKTLTKSGTYYDTLANAVGCDSIITLNLTINTVNNAVSLSGKTLAATETGATYQWLDCSNGNKIISGATSQTYIPTLTGDYACVITKNSCTDTSNCVNVIVTGVNELRISNYELRIYPNPTTGIINLEFSTSIKEDMEVKVYDIVGQVCHAELVEANTITKAIDMRGKANGVYLIECISKEGVVRERVLLE